ncbi:MAG: potassium channel family protein, partial [Actinomycetota bacterium]|nr:potassium channel family protein [Actinomycetota bacterium]
MIAAVMADVIATLVATAGSGTGWRPTRQFYRATWAAWSRLSRARRSSNRRERLLSLYGPMSLLALLLLWLCGLLFGWALVWYGLRRGLEGDTGFGSHLYYSGIVLLTVGFGDITPARFGTRMLTLAEAVTGLGTIALVISYLPALYGSFNRRETRLLTLDHPSGERIQPAALIVLHAPDGDLQRLYRYFAEWELWVAELLESHVSYPMLAFFRSQHAGQSWITALGVVVDAAALTSAVVEGADEREPFFLYRRGRRAINEIARRLGTAGEDED